jgi:hypothetical protein
MIAGLPAIFMSVMPIIKTIKDKIISAFHVADKVMRGKAVETIEYEVGEPGKR